VVATQNPIELQGTFPLPEAQLDRFMMCLKMGYPEKKEELSILDSQQEHHPLENIHSVISLEEIRQIQSALPRVHLHPHLKNYIVSIVRATRHHKDILLGASPRAVLALSKASQAYALFDKKSFVTPQIIKDLVIPVLAHRLILNPQSRISQVTSQSVLDEILKTIPAPVEMESEG
jgi:MoxR-like ATPase